MKNLNLLLFTILISGLMFSCQSSTKDKSENSKAKKVTEKTPPPIVSQDNFPQAYTNMRLGAVLQKTGGVNKFFEMPVPSSIPEEQFVV